MLDAKGLPASNLLTQAFREGRLKGDKGAKGDKGGSGNIGKGHATHAALPVAT